MAPGQSCSRSVSSAMELTLPSKISSVALQRDQYIDRRDEAPDPSGWSRNRTRLIRRLKVSMPLAHERADVSFAARSGAPAIDSERMPATAEADFRQPRSARHLIMVSRTTLS